MINFCKKLILHIISLCCRRERRRQCGTTIRYLTECPGDDVEFEDCQQGNYDNSI